MNNQNNQNNQNRTNQVSNRYYLGMIAINISKSIHRKKWISNVSHIIATIISCIVSLKLTEIIYNVSQRRVDTTPFQEIFTGGIYLAVFLIGLAAGYYFLCQGVKCLIANITLISIRETEAEFVKAITDMTVALPPEDIRAMKANMRFNTWFLRQYPVSMNITIVHGLLMEHFKR